MPNKIFNIRLRNKRDTEANWEKKNPLILDGEIIVVTTTSGETRVKIGDGAKTYTQLPFLDDVSVNMPIATSSTVGAIKVGNGLSISADGTLSVTTATYYTGTAAPVNNLGADGDLYLKTEG